MAILASSDVPVDSPSMIGFRDDKTHRLIRLCWQGRLGVALHSCSHVVYTRKSNTTSIALVFNFDSILTTGYSNYVDDCVEVVL